MGLVLSEEFLGVFVMEKRRESMETHSEGKDGDPRDHQKHIHGDDDVDDGRVFPKRKWRQGSHQSHILDSGAKSQRGQKSLCLLKRKSENHLWLIFDHQSLIGDAD